MPDALDLSKTLFLPAARVPMRYVPSAEAGIIESWASLPSEPASDKPALVLHDGPPYANGDIHIGHALNKVLKDFCVRSRRAMGMRVEFVPGWDCHGLPIEWKVEEAYRKRREDRRDVPVNAFRAECRAFAQGWVDRQAAQFARLGISGGMRERYLTMDPKVESAIAGELYKFVDNGTLYRATMPVAWSVVEQTTLAEAEIDNLPMTSPAVYVGFPLKGRADGCDLLIWTTTPWTLPANRAVAYSTRVAYGVYEQAGRRYALADALAESTLGPLGAYARVEDFVPAPGMLCAHPYAGQGYDFDVPLLPGDHVTEAAGTGFVHTAPGHGRDDYMVWTAHREMLAGLGVETRVPVVIDGMSAYTDEAPGFEGEQVMDVHGRWRGANQANLDRLAACGRLLRQEDHSHQYPHSWRSKKPVITRNTPQWFVGIDTPMPQGVTIRRAAEYEIERVEWVPPQSKARIRGMVASRPDWLLSRQRAWGVPMALFVDRETGKVLDDEGTRRRILDAFAAETSDAWFADGAAARFLPPGTDPDRYEKVDDILDVWFDSGASHRYVTGEPSRFRKVLYVEGSDQHRGWFQSSLLESCATNLRAPFDMVITHGFALDGKGRKMAKSEGNVVDPLEMVERNGADVLRLWVALSDFTSDLRVDKRILQGVEEAHRKIRNTLRWMVGNLAHRAPGVTLGTGDRGPAPLERYMLHRLSEVGATVSAAYAAFDFGLAARTVLGFLTDEVSALYGEARKDALYCDAHTSVRRLDALATIDLMFENVVAWLAPILPFTAEELWGAAGREGSATQLLLDDPARDLKAWNDPELGRRWSSVLKAREAVLAELEVNRQGGRIKTGLETHVTYSTRDADFLAAGLTDEQFAEICVVSGLTVMEGDESVVVGAPRGLRCDRSWRWFEDVGSDPDHPGLSARDARAVREWTEIEGGIRTREEA